MPKAVTIEPLDDFTCLASVGADSPEILAQYLGMLGADFEVVDAPELTEHLRALGERMLRAANAVHGRTQTPAEP